MEKYVIIGNGVAAAGCIEGIRSTDKASPITLISKENHPVYCRPLISYYLEGKTTPKKMQYRPADFYEKNGVRVLYCKTAKKIDPKAGVVYLDDHTEEGYTKLCVAAGSSPFVPPFSGLETVQNKCTFQTLDDMLTLESLLTPDSRVLIVGAGLIGLKCAEGICKRVASVTVCDLADRVLSSILDAECAAWMQQRLEENGICFYLGNSVAQFEQNRALLQNGEQVDFDVVVLAVGVRASTALVSDIGGKVERGIVVDEHSATDVKNIYAAGDCTACYDISAGTVRPLAILPNAYIQGHCAGVNMAGGCESFCSAVPMNSIGFFGLHAMSAGSYYTAEQGGQMYEEKDENHLKRLFTKDGVLTGYILIGETERAGIYTNMVRNRIPLAETDFALLLENPSLLPFGSAFRKEKLGGEV